MIFFTKKHIRKRFRSTNVPIREEYRLALRERLIQQEQAFSLAQQPMMKHSKKLFWVSGITVGSLGFALLVYSFVLPMRNSSPNQVANTPVKIFNILSIKTALAQSLNMIIQDCSTDTFCYKEFHITEIAGEQADNLTSYTYKKWSAAGLNRRIDTIPDSGSVMLTKDHESEFYSLYDRQHCSTFNPYQLEQPYFCEDIYEGFGMGRASGGKETFTFSTTNTDVQPQLIAQNGGYYIHWYTTQPLTNSIGTSVNIVLTGDGVNPENAIGYTEDPLVYINKEVGEKYEQSTRVQLDASAIAPATLQVQFIYQQTTDTTPGFLSTPETPYDLNGRWQTSAVYEMNLAQQSVRMYTDAELSALIQAVYDINAEQLKNGIDRELSDVGTVVQHYIEQLDIAPTEQYNAERNGEQILIATYPIDQQAYIGYAFPRNPNTIELVVNPETQTILEFTLVDEQGVIYTVSVNDSHIITDTTPADFFRVDYWKNDLGLK